MVIPVGLAPGRQTMQKTGSSGHLLNSLLPVKSRAVGHWYNVQAQT